MPYIGLRKPIVGKRNSDGTYGDPLRYGKAVAMTVTPNYAEGSSYADDAQDEYDKEYTNADITLGTNYVPIKAEPILFGHEIDEETGHVIYNANDQSNEVGVGIMRVEKINGARKYTAIFIFKAKFSEPSEDYETKGESITYKTPSISGKATPIDDGRWKESKICDTMTDALSWIYSMFGKILGTLTVQSAASSTADGKTKLTVTPEKEGDNTYVYKTGANVELPAYDDTCNAASGWKTWDGTEEITAKTGDKIVVVEIDEDALAKKAGTATVAAKEATQTLSGQNAAPARGNTESEDED